MALSTITLYPYFIDIIPEENKDPNPGNIGQETGIHVYRVLVNAMNRLCIVVSMIRNTVPQINYSHYIGNVDCCGNNRNSYRHGIVD